MTHRELSLIVFTMLALNEGKVINYSDIVSFDQPKPVTIADKLAVEFKPQVQISGGYHPNPVVDKDGNTENGWEYSDPNSESCNGSSLGSQVYGRAKFLDGTWAIMYVWYFPKNSNGWGIESRHLWLETVVWSDNFVSENPTVLAVSTWHHGDYHKYVPPTLDTLDGTSIKLDSGNTMDYGYTLDATKKTGKIQDLIMWNQLSEAASSALQCTDFNGLSAPITDARLDNLLEDAYQFKPIYD